MSENTEKRRGRPKGVSREIFVVCIGLYEGQSGPELAAEKIQVSGNKDSVNSQLVEMAKNTFESKFGVKPLHVHGPFFERRSNLAYSRKRDSIHLDADEILFSGKKARAELNGWRVTVQYLSNRDDAAYVIFKDEITPGEKKKAKPAPKTVKLDSLTNVQDM